MSKALRVLPSVSAPPVAHLKRHKAYLLCRAFARWGPDTADTARPSAGDQQSLPAGLLSRAPGLNASQDRRSTNVQRVGHTVPLIAAADLGARKKEHFDENE